MVQISLEADANTTNRGCKSLFKNQHIEQPSARLVSANVVPYSHSHWLYISKWFAHSTYFENVDPNSVQ